MSIISPLTYTIANGQAVDAVPLMADLNQIVSNVNANAAALAGSSSQVFNVANAATSTEAVALGQAQAGGYNYAADTGTANTYAMALTPAPAAITPGMLVGIRGIVAANTGASTLNLNGLGALPIQGPGAAAMQGGEFVAGGSAILQANADATAWNLIWTSGAQPVAAASQSGQAVNLGQFPSSFASSGYQKLPNGLIIQWGTVTGPASGSANTFYSTAFNWPIAFPNAIVAVSGSLSVGLAASTFVNVDFESRTLTGANFIYAIGAAFSTAPQITYIAIGW